MISANTFPQRLTKIDDLTRPDHFYLTAQDDCYFLGEYTARKGYAFSATNQLILNFKKGMEKRGTAQWKYKERAIEEAAGAFRAALNNDWLNVATLVPIPPSKARTDPLYDDRMLRMTEAIRPQPRPDIRELVAQRASMAAAHEQDQRPPRRYRGKLYHHAGAAKPCAYANRSIRRRAHDRRALPCRIQHPATHLSKRSHHWAFHRPARTRSHRLGRD